MILRVLTAALAKDLRLLVRDRVGLAFLTVAPIVVITVAGLSLASLYGAGPRGQTAYVLPLVDEDGGAVGEALRTRLAAEGSVKLRPVADRADAMALLERRTAGVALVIPPGTSRALTEGRQSTLLLLTDPVKYLEVANVRGLVQELRHEIEARARQKAAQRLERARHEAEEQRAEFEARLAASRGTLEALRSKLAEVRREIARRIETGRRQTKAELSAYAGAERRRIEESLSRELEPVRAFVTELSARQRDFQAWLATVRERAGRFADRMPPPPTLPEVPPELRRLAASTPAEWVDHLLSGDAARFEPPSVADVEIPALPSFPKVDLPALTLPSPGPLPGEVRIDERSVTGAPSRLNTFDQNVPGFGVTFLLLGMLLGVSLGVLDERDWGTLERLRSMPPPVSVVLVAKVISRFLVGLVQMTLLFAVGWAAFGVSLGPEPWALLLPTVGIVFAGATFGMVVAGCSRSREAVLPIGSMAIMTMAAVGGCWWPIDLEPQWMRSVARVLPTTWAMAAYNDLMIRRQGFEAALWPMAVLCAHGALYLIAGAWLLRRQLGRAG